MKFSRRIWFGLVAGFVSAGQRLRGARKPESPHARPNARLELLDSSGHVRTAVYVRVENGELVAPVCFTHTAAYQVSYWRLHSGVMPPITRALPAHYVAAGDATQVDSLKVTLTEVGMFNPPEHWTNSARVIDRQTFEKPVTLRDGDEITAVSVTLPL
jgi:hypothetical protein